METSGKEKLSTIGSAYLGIEVKEGFDKFNLGETDIKIEMRPRTGVGKYTNFSNHLIIVSANPRSKYPVGTHVWVANTVVDDRVVADKELFPEHKGVFMYPFKDNNVVAVGEDITECESEDWVITEMQKGKEELKGSIYVYSQPRNDVANVVSGCLEGLSKGDEVKWIPKPRLELWQKEKQYWAVFKDYITSVNDKPHGNYYELDKFDNFEYEVGGVVVKGKLAAQKKYNITPARHQMLAKLHNPSLPYNGKVALVFQPKSQATYANEVIYLVEDNQLVVSDLVLDAKKPRNLR